MNARWLLLVLAGQGCTTTYVQMEGQCVMQEWALSSVTVRKRMLCELPVPHDKDELRERDPVDPFPGLLERHNKADSVDPDLLEKSMGLPQEGDD